MTILEKEKGISFFLNHVVRTLYTAVRIYQEGGKLLSLYGIRESELDEKNMQMNELLEFCRDKAYPCIWMNQYPIYYSAIHYEDGFIVTGPVIIERQESAASRHLPKLSDAKMPGEHSLHSLRDEYEQFCEETLLLYYVCTGNTMSYQQLNEANFRNEDLIHSVNRTEGELMFDYHEYDRKHNPYDREQREMESIRRGDEQMLIRTLDEVFSGKYAVLSRNPLRAAKNLAIVGLAISARAAIEGGIPFEVAFSVNDNYIQRVDESQNIGEIEALVRQCKIQYAGMVNILRSEHTTNPLIEDCKNLIFEMLHVKISERELAAKLGVSPEYLSACFKKETGVTITEYIQVNKLRLAKNMLIYSGNTIDEIAMYLGYSSQSHFGSIFKKMEGMTPTVYRKKYRNKEFQN